MTSKAKKETEVNRLTKEVKALRKEVDTLQSRVGELQYYFSEMEIRENAFRFRTQNTFEDIWNIIDPD